MKIPQLTNPDGTPYKLDHVVFICQSDDDRACLEKYWSELGSPYILVEQKIHYYGTVYYDYGFGHLFLIKGNVVLDHDRAGYLVVGNRLVYLGEPYQPHTGLYMKC